MNGHKPFLVKASVQMTENWYKPVYMQMFRENLTTAPKVHFSKNHSATKLEILWCVIPFLNYTMISPKIKGPTEEVNNMISLLWNVLLSSGKFTFPHVCLCCLHACFLPAFVQGVWTQDNVCPSHMVGGRGLKIMPLYNVWFKTDHISLWISDDWLVNSNSMSTTIDQFKYLWSGT